MSKQAEHSVKKAEDSVQQRLTAYACGFAYESLPPEAVHIAKARIIDNLGALVAGFFGEPGRILRNMAAQISDPRGASIVGTRMKTTPDMAAFVNATTARDSELMDIYHYPGSYHGHPSDMVMTVFAVAEHVNASGRDFIASVVLAYEVYLRLCDVFHNSAFDASNFTTMGSAVAAGKLFGLAPEAMAHCISMAAVPNIMLKQVRKGHLSMYKAAAAGHAGRAGVFAAQLARAGMEGPHLPFEGKAGWCEHVARERFSIGAMGGGAEEFKILYTRLKTRPVEANSIPAVLAAEKLAVLADPENVAQVTVEVFERAWADAGIGDHHWNPESRDTADHSIPYCVSAALLFGKVTLNSFSDTYLWNPRLRALMPKVRVVENADFTRANEALPVEHRSRVIVEMKDGRRLVAEDGGDAEDLGQELSDEKVMQKFRGLTEDTLGTTRVSRILDRLWHIEDLGNVSSVIPDFVLD